MLLPGMFYFDNDRHSTNAGAIGAFGFRIGAGNQPRARHRHQLGDGAEDACGSRSRASSRPGVYARDLGFYIARLLKQGALDFDLDYRVLEFAGDLDQFDLATRTALCSSPTEMRAYGVFFPAVRTDSCTMHASAQSVPSRRSMPTPTRYTKRKRHLDIGGVEPQVVQPGGVHRAVDISEAAGQTGRSRVHRFVRLGHVRGLRDRRTVAARAGASPPPCACSSRPAPSRSTKRLLHDGLLQIFIEAGAILLPAGCGPATMRWSGRCTPVRCRSRPPPTATPAASARAKTQSSFSAARRPSPRPPSPATSPIRALRNVQ